MTATNTFSNKQVYININYGLLYNTYAATNIKNIANTGWRIPTNDECVALRTYLDSDGIFNNNTAGSLMKEASLIYWTDITGNTNISKFNARGAGARYIVELDGVFSLSKESLVLVTSNQYAVGWQRTCILNYNNSSFYAGNGSTPGTYNISDQKSGISIRLIKESTTLIDGESGSYMGNDGKYYPTICIGTQEWLACNLAETLYRDKDAIPEVTDGETWAGLTTGALCAYNNDWSNV